MKRLLVAVIASACLNCGAGDSEQRTDVSCDTTGNTIRSVTREIVSPQVATGPTVLLRDDRLDSPRRLAKNGGHLIIGDRTEIHILGLRDGHVKTVGRNGEGPGEYRSVAAVAATVSGDFLVLDSRLGRLTVLDSSGVYKDSRQLESLNVLRMPVGGRLREHGAGLLMVWSSGLVNPGGEPLDVAAVWDRGDGDRTEIVRVKDTEMVDGGRFIVPRDPYGPRPLIALGPDGLVANTDGLEYCITVRQVGSVTVRELCREWERGRAGPDPSLDQLRKKVEVSEATVAVWESRSGAEELGLRNSIESLLFDSDGNLWVKVLQPATRYSVMTRARWPEYRPEYYTWDVIARSGHRLAEVLLPNAFIPILVEGEHVYGTLELDTGELVIAEFEVHLPSEHPPVFSGSVQ